MNTIRFPKGCVLGALILAALMGCSERATPAGAHPARAASPAPAAPIELAAQVPGQAPAGQPLTITADITTPVKHGSLTVKLAAQQGVTMLTDPFQRIDLDSARQPLPVTIELLPGVERQRYVVLLVTIDTGEVPLSRSFRIALPDGEGASENTDAPANSRMKMLPAGPAR